MTPAEKLVRIVDYAKGDNLERAKRAFGNLSETELNEIYGHSGKTKRQILEEYETERAEWQAARDFLQLKLRRTP